LGLSHISYLDASNVLVNTTIAIIRVKTTNEIYAEILDAAQVWEPRLLIRHWLQKPRSRTNSSVLSCLYVIISSITKYDNV